jgi:uncharacterized damage-inducible protein DinB
MSDDVATLFLAAAKDKLIGQYWPRMKKAIEPLSDEQIWWRPNEASNSIGNLLLHLNGNVQQWLVASFERQADARNRPAEFNERDRIDRNTLVAALDATLARASAVLDRLTEEDLRRTYTIQRYTVSGLFAVFQVVEHFSMHYGQTLYIAKQLTGNDLGFYRELNTR